MAFSPGLERPIRLLPCRQPWPRQVFASSVALHVLGFALAGWGTHGKFRLLISPSGEHLTRAYALHYLVLSRPATRPERRPPNSGPAVDLVNARVRAPTSAPMSLPATAPVTAPLTAPAASRSATTVVDPASRSAPSGPAVQTEELAPGAIRGVGRIIPTPNSDSTGRSGLAGMLGFRTPAAGIEPARRGLERVAELLGVAGSACPELRRPAAGRQRQIAVAVAFVVDTTGAVDPATLRVVESPERPQTEHQFHSRIYVVGATVRPDPGGIDPTVYDSVVTAEVAGHVAGLVFRPALRDGQAIRSTVLVACQTS